MPYPDRMSTLKPIVNAATIAAMAPPPARTKSPPFCLPGARASARPRPRFQGVFNTENAAKLAPLWDGKMPSEKFHPARAEGAFVAVQMMKEACGRFSQPARALPISSTQIGNLLVIQSFASTSLWNPEISSKAPSSQVARTAQVSAEDVSECRIWRAGSFVMIALAVNQPPSGPFSPMQLVNARQNIKFGLGAPRRDRRLLGDRARLALACETSSREQATRHIRQKNARTYRRWDENSRL